MERKEEYRHYIEPEVKKVQLSLENKDLYSRFRLFMWERFPDEREGSSYWEEWWERVKKDNIEKLGDAVAVSVSVSRKYGILKG